MWFRNEQPVSYCPVKDYPQHPTNIQESKLVVLVNHNIQLHFVKIKKITHTNPLNYQFVDFKVIIHFHDHYDNDYIASNNLFREVATLTKKRAVFEFTDK